MERRSSLTRCRAAIATLALVIAAGCGGGDDGVVLEPVPAGEDDDEPRSTTTTTDAPTTTAVTSEPMRPPGSTIDTGLGPLVVSSVQVLDQFPPGCGGADDPCDAPLPGVRYVIVVLADPSGAPLGIDAHDALVGDALQSSVLVSDGTDIDAFSIHTEDPFQVAELGYQLESAPPAVPVALRWRRELVAVELGP